MVTKNLHEGFCDTGILESETQSDNKRDTLECMVPNSYPEYCVCGGVG
jgi:hypothetical protein